MLVTFGSWWPSSLGVGGFVISVASLALLAAMLRVAAHLLKDKNLNRGIDLFGKLLAAGAAGLALVWTIVGVASGSIGL